MKNNTCTQCGETKPITDFCKDKSYKSGRKNLCKNCHILRCQKWKSSNSPKALAIKMKERERAERFRERLSKKMIKMECNKCKETKLLSEFSTHSTSKNGKRQPCKNCDAVRVKELKQSSPEILEKYRSKARDYTRKLRLDVLQAYGGFCVCCGESSSEFLAVDHIYNDGAKERKENKTVAFYNLLKKNNFPKDRYQLLCHNCNFAKGIYGECPHKTNLKRLIPIDRVAG